MTSIYTHEVACGMSGASPLGVTRIRTSYPFCRSNRLPVSSPTLGVPKLVEANRYDYDSRVGFVCGHPLPVWNPSPGTLRSAIVPSCHGVIAEMQRRQLGESGLNVSTIALGTWAMGGEVEIWGDVDDRESIAAIHQALDSGINLIDTAPIYGLGHSEEIVGKAIKRMDSEGLLCNGSLKKERFKNKKKKKLKHLIATKSEILKFLSANTNYLNISDKIGGKICQCSSDIQMFCKSEITCSECCNYKTNLDDSEI